MSFSSNRISAAVMLLLATLLVGCRNGQSTITNPFASADRVPAPATRLITPGTAQPYYSGGPLPQAGAPIVTPGQPFAQPAPAFGQPQTFGQTPAFGQTPPAAFGQAPAAFGQAQSPLIQAQPFGTPAAAPQTFAPAQPFGQPLPSTAPAQPFAPTAPFNPGSVPQGSGARGSGARVAPASPAFSTAQISPAARFAGDENGVAIPSDDQTVRPAFAQQQLAPQQPTLTPAFNQPTPQPVLPAASNHVAVRMTPVRSGGSFGPSSVTQASAQASPNFSALPSVNANLPWISGSAPRPAAPRLSPVVQAGGFATLPNAAPVPRVRLPGANTGAVQVTELTP